jgi:hypothetical protein
MLNVFNLHFPTPAVEAISRICACKTERNLQVFGWCLQFKQSCPWATLSYFLSAKQSREINAMRRVVFRKCIKKSSALSIRLECEEVSLQIEFTTLPPKNHKLFVRNWNEKGIGEKELQPQANNAQYNTQGENGVGGWGEVRRQWGEGGRRLLYTNLYLSRVNSMTMLINFSILLKRDFYLL